AAQDLENGCGEPAGGPGALLRGLLEEAADQGEVGRRQRRVGRGVGGLPGGELAAEGAEQPADGLVGGDALADAGLRLQRVATSSGRTRSRWRWATIHWLERRCSS